jgi:hypothetical protein
LKAFFALLHSTGPHSIFFTLCSASSPPLGSTRRSELSRYDGGPGELDIKSRGDSTQDHFLLTIVGVLLEVGFAIAASPLYLRSSQLLVSLEHRSCFQPSAPTDPAIANSIHAIRDAEQRRHTYRDACPPRIQTYEYGITEYSSRSPERRRPRLATCSRPDGKIRWPAQPARKTESVEDGTHSKGRVVLILYRYFTCAMQVLSPRRLPGRELLPFQP